MITRSQFEFITRCVFAAIGVLEGAYLSGGHDWRYVWFGAVWWLLLIPIFWKRSTP